MLSLAIPAGTANIIVDKKTIGVSETLTFKLPDRDNSGHVLLKLTCLQPAAKYSGFLHMMKLEINGSPLQPKFLEEIPLLINKAPEFLYKPKNTTLPFYKDGKWLVVYNKDYSAPPAYTGLDGESYTYVFDVTPLLSRSNNILTINNTWTKKAEERYKKKLQLEVSVETSLEANSKANAEFNEICDTTILPVETEKEWEIQKSGTDKRLLLCLETWQPRKRFGGFSYPLILMVNGKPVNAKFDRATDILLNKPNKFTYHGKGKYLNFGSGTWLSMYSPGPGTALKKHGIGDPNPYTYLLDITPFIQEGRNTITIRNNWTKSSERQYKQKMDLTVRMRSIIVPAKNTKVETSGDKPDLAGEITLRSLPGGGFEIKSGKYSLPVISMFSQEGGGWNCLGAKDEKKSGQAWKVLSQDKSGKLSVTAENKEYKLERSVKLVDRRIKIEDKFINKTGKDIAIRQRNLINFSGYNLPVCRMGGLESHSVNDYFSAANSTMFLPVENSSIGWVMEDDVLRNHGRMYYRLKEKEFGVDDDFFALAAEKSYTVKWSLYVLPDDDYFTFINRVRNDRGANFTIPGPFYFVNLSYVFGASPEQLKKEININNAEYISFWELRTPRLPETNNLIIAGYADALWNPVMKKYVAEAKQAIEKLHGLNLGIKATVYTHCFFAGFEKDGDLTHRDSWIINSDGKRAKSVYDFKNTFTYKTVYPTWDNSFGRLFRKTLDFYIDELKVDWYYWDESTGPGVTAANRQGASSSTFSTWDGNSAIIDFSNNKIEKKFGILAIVSKDIFKYAIKRIYSRPGGLILFNGPATTGYRLNTLSMAETQDHIQRCYETHLNTPLAYGFGTPNFNEIVERLDYGCLYIRTHLNYPCDAVTKFYPFTPMELHKGWVKGKERIISNRSGSFGWNGKFAARIWGYDKAGKKLTDKPEIKNYDNQVKIDVPNGGLAIIERTDLTRNDFPNSKVE